MPSELPSRSGSTVLEPNRFWYHATQVCGQRPKFKDGNKVHDFCGKACATKAQSANGVTPAPKPDLCAVCVHTVSFISFGVFGFDLRRVCLLACRSVDNDRSSTMANERLITAVNTVRARRRRRRRQRLFLLLLRLSSL